MFTLAGTITNYIVYCCITSNSFQWLDQQILIVLDVPLLIIQNLASRFTVVITVIISTRKMSLTRLYIFVTLSQD